MNLFGAFTFGSLIKRFLPGFVLLAALFLLDADLAQVTGRTTTLWTLAASKDQATLVVAMAIPISILLGLISNIMVFMGINDRLVREPVKKSNPSLWSLHTELCHRIRNRCWNCLNGIDSSHQEVFDSKIDAEIILLNLTGVEQLSYVREQYWFHLEFQLNLMLSTMIVTVALMFSIMVNAGSNTARVAFACWCLAIATGVIWLLLHAARKNYERHVGKMASAMAAALCASYTPPEPT
jgi:hypothetical protein